MRNRRLRKQQHRRKRQMVKRTKQFALSSTYEHSEYQKSNLWGWPELLGLAAVFGIIISAAIIIFR